MGGDVLEFVENQIYAVVLSFGEHGHHRFGGFLHPHKTKLGKDVLVSRVDLEAPAYHAFGPFLANRQHFHLALPRQISVVGSDVRHRGFDNVGIERPAQPPVGSDHDKQHLFHRTRLPVRAIGSRLATRRYRR